MVLSGCAAQFLGIIQFLTLRPEDCGQGVTRCLEIQRSTVTALNRRVITLLSLAPQMDPRPPSLRRCALRADGEEWEPWSPQHIQLQLFLTFFCLANVAATLECEYVCLHFDLVAVLLWW